MLTEQFGFHAAFFGYAALSGVSVWFPGVVIGVVTTTLSSVGIVFGGRLGTRWGQHAEIAGGCVLLAIGAKILVEHTLLG